MSNEIVAITETAVSTVSEAVGELLKLAKENPVAAMGVGALGVAALALYVAHENNKAGLERDRMNHENNREWREFVREGRGTVPPIIEG